MKPRLKVALVNFTALEYKYKNHVIKERIRNLTKTKPIVIASIVLIKLRNPYEVGTCIVTQHKENMRQTIDTIQKSSKKNHEDHKGNSF